MILMPKELIPAVEAAAPVQPQMQMQQQMLPERKKTLEDLNDNVFRSMLSTECRKLGFELE